MAPAGCASGSGRSTASSIVKGVPRAVRSSALASTSTTEMRIVHTPAPTCSYASATRPGPVASTSSRHALRGARKGMTARLHLVLVDDGSRRPAEIAFHDAKGLVEIVHQVLAGDDPHHGLRRGVGRDVGRCVEPVVREPEVRRLGRLDDQTRIGRRVIGDVGVAAEEEAVARVARDEAVGNPQPVEMTAQVLASSRRTSRSRSRAP